MAKTSGKRYAAFYTYPIYWVDKNDLLNKIKKGELVNLIEKIFEKKTNKYELILLRDGLILYRESDLEDQIVKDETKIFEEKKYWFDPTKNTIKVRNRYLKIMNLIQFLLDCVNHRIHLYEINPINFYRITLPQDNGDFKIKDYSLNSHVITFHDPKTQLANYEEIETGVNNLDKNDALVWFSDMYEKFLRKIIKNDDQINSIFRLIKCLNEFQMENYQNSFVLGWFIIESYIDLLFKNYVNEVKNKKIIPKPDFLIKFTKISPKKEIKKYLKKKIVPTFFKIHILERQGLLNLGLDQLVRFIHFRNDIVHAWKLVDKNQCQELLKFLKSNSKTIFGIFLPFNEHGLSVSGL